MAIVTTLCFILLQQMRLPGFQADIGLAVFSVRAHRREGCGQFGLFTSIPASFSVLCITGKNRFRGLCQFNVKITHFFTFKSASINYSFI